MPQRISPELLSAILEGAGAILAGVMGVLVVRMYPSKQVNPVSLWAAVLIGAVVTYYFGPALAELLPDAIKSDKSVAGVNFLVGVLSLALVGGLIGFGDKYTPRLMDRLGLSLLDRVGRGAPPAPPTPPQGGDNDPS